MTTNSANSPTDAATTRQPSACKGCPQEDQCRAVWSQPSQNNLDGPRLALVGLIGFILPLATAAAGAMLMYRYVSPDGEHSWLDALGAFIGLAIGVVPAVILVRAISRQSKS